MSEIAKANVLIWHQWLWLVLPVTAVTVFALFGLPHFCWSYRYLDNGTRDPFAERFYTFCTYHGPRGSIGFYKPTDGHCPWFKLFPLNVNGEG